MRLRSRFVLAVSVLLAGVGDTRAATDDFRLFFERLSPAEIEAIKAKADSGGVDAQFLYSVYLDNSAQAGYYRHSAATGGNPFALSGECLLEMAGSDEVAPTTVSCFKAANEGDPIAQSMLGLAYDHGLLGLQQNKAAAVNWYRQAAFQGDALALTRMGDLYSAGEGVQQDFALAAHYWTRAASVDSVSALRSLGVAHILGNGVSQDADKSLKYFHRASEFGDGSSQYAAGIIYRGRQDYTSALVMQLLALKSLEPGEMRDKAIRERTDLDNMLFPDQRAKAQRIAKAWRKKEVPEAPYVAGAGFTMKLQASLNERGFAAGDVDGIAGPATRKAFRNFAATIGLSDASFKAPDIYYVAYKLELYGLAPTTVAKQSPTPEPPQPSTGPSAATEPAKTDAPQPSRPPAMSSGSGFAINSEGYIVTNAHVVKDCVQTTIIDARSGRSAATIVKISEFTDLAVLKISGSVIGTLTLRSGGQAQLGESLVVFGYPLTNYLSDQGNLTVGNVTALAGMHGDPSFLQISAAVQPGNSGGPALDARGNLIGVVVAKLNAIKIAAETDDIPQNINFAIKSSVLENFLQANSIPYATSNDTSAELPVTKLAEQARNAAVRIECVGH